MENQPTRTSQQIEKELAAARERNQQIEREDVDLKKEIRQAREALAAIPGDEPEEIPNLPKERPGFWKRNWLKLGLAGLIAVPGGYFGGQKAGEKMGESKDASTDRAITENFAPKEQKGFYKIKAKDISAEVKKIREKIEKDLNNKKSKKENTKDSTTRVTPSTTSGLSELTQTTEGVKGDLNANLATLDDLKKKLGEIKTPEIKTTTPTPEEIEAIRQAQIDKETAEASARRQAEAEITSARERERIRGEIVKENERIKEKLIEFNKRAEAERKNEQKNNSKFYSDGTPVGPGVEVTSRGRGGDNIVYNTNPRGVNPNTPPPLSQREQMLGNNPLTPEALRQLQQVEEAHEINIKKALPKNTFNLWEKIKDKSADEFMSERPDREYRKYHTYLKKIQAMSGINPKSGVGGIIETNERYERRALKKLVEKGVDLEKTNFD